MKIQTAILGVPLSTGTGGSALTVTVTDVSGNIATQMVSFSVVSPQSSVFSYDQNGNLSSVQSVSSVDYSYDAENRLVKAVSNSVTVFEAWYDGAGHRIAKREVIGTQTNSWQYIWDGWNLVAVLGVDGKLKEFYTRGVGIAGDIGTLVAVRHWTNVISGPLYYLHNNHRGDVILARQGSATVAALDYAPYGESRSQTGSYAPRFRFSSKEYDASTGFYHFPYRYYAPQWARWMTRDPLGVAGGINLYFFCQNDPVTRLDPSGLASIGTGVKKCENGSHGWIEIGGDWSAGFYAGGYGGAPGGGGSSGGCSGYGPIFGGPGYIISPDPASTGTKTCKEIKLDDSKYDIDAFKECIKDKAAGPAPAYWVIGNNCYDWVSDTISDCKKKAKKCK
jgi:RHS repeat-associated protein